VPTKRLILYDEWAPERARLNGARSVFLAAGTRRDFSVIAKDLLLAHTRDALAKTGG